MNTLRVAASVAFGIDLALVGLVIENDLGCVHSCDVAHGMSSFIIGRLLLWCALVGAVLAFCWWRGSRWGLWMVLLLAIAPFVAIGEWRLLASIG